MGIHLDIAPVTDEHIEDLSNTMRAIDKAELWALGHRVPRQVVPEAVAESDITRAVLTRDGRLVGIFGFKDAGPVGEVGIPWLLGTELLDKEKQGLVRLGRDMMFAMLRVRYRVLQNVIWDRNEKTIRWLKHMGFEISEAKKGSTGHSYREFTMRREDMPDV